MLKSCKPLKISLLPLWMRISTPLNGITVVFEMAKWINSGNYDASVKEALAAMLEVFGLSLLRKFWMQTLKP